MSGDYTQRTNTALAGTWPPMAEGRSISLRHCMQLVFARRYYLSCDRP